MLDNGVFRDSCLPFIDWIKNAETDSDTEDDDDTDSDSGSD
jgi:hypothetical protein